MHKKRYQKPTSGQGSLLCTSSIEIRVKIFGGESTLFSLRANDIPWGTKGVQTAVVTLSVLPGLSFSAF